MTILHLDGLRALARDYDGFVIDLWGVIHDGVTPYDGAVDCLEHLRGQGARIVLLSNAPRRAYAAEQGLRRLGIDGSLYDAVVTSGEATWQALGACAGARVLHLGPDRDRNVLEGRDLLIVDRAEDADLLLNTGPDDQRGPVALETYLPQLQTCLAHRLPMICANPDLEIVSAGRRLICAGALALWYQAEGGQVRWIGKPYPEVYELVWPVLDGIDRARVLAVGDALRTDVAGAATAGIDCCWVLGGMHALESTSDAEREAEQAGLRPSATLPRFVW